MSSCLNWGELNSPHLPFIFNYIKYIWLLWEIVTYFWSSWARLVLRTAAVVCLSVPVKQCLLGRQPPCSGISLPRGAACCLWNQFLRSCLSLPDRYGPNALLLVCHFGSIGVKWPGVVTGAGGPLGFCQVGIAGFALCELFRDVSAECVRARC